MEIALLSHEGRLLDNLTIWDMNRIIFNGDYEKLFNPI